MSILPDFAKNFIKKNITTAIIAIAINNPNAPKPLMNSREARSSKNFPKTEAIVFIVPDITRTIISRIIESGDSAAIRNNCFFH